MSSFLAGPNPPGIPKIGSSGSPYGDKGFPLPEFLRKKMEDVFKCDFSKVLIYLDKSLSKRGLNACANGLTISIDPHQYDPWSEKGRRLIAHELAHVVQYLEGRVPIGFQNLLIDPKLEKEAHEWQNKPVL